MSRLFARLQHYLDNDAKLKKFVPIIQDSIVFPVILDANRTVLSLPPIINSAHSAVRLLDLACSNDTCVHHNLQTQLED